MAGTYSQILLHVVFSTKAREGWLTPDVAVRLYPYIGGIIRKERGVLYDIGGVEDHVHLYMRWRPDGAVSDLMRAVKARSRRGRRGGCTRRLRIWVGLRGRRGMGCSA